MKKVFFLFIIIFSGCSEGSDGLESYQLNFDHLNIIAHRGVSHYAPENSLKAIEKTLSTKVNIVEFDVQLSKDSVIMIFHDDELIRMTGKPGRVMNYTKNELQSFNLKDKNGNFSEETIPTLEEVFNRLGDSIDYYIEIKQFSFVLEKKLVETILAYQLEKKVSILSFNNKSLKRISEMNSGIPLRLLIYESNPYLTDKATPPDYDHLDGIILPYEMVNLNLLIGISQWTDQIDVFTVNSVSNLGGESYQYVKGIITDEPESWISLKKK